MTVATLEFPGPLGGNDRPTLILLPGADMTAQDFVTHDFVGEVQRREVPIDILCVDSSIDAYLDNTIVENLRALILSLAPSRRLWLAGISLGGMGALLYAGAYPDSVAGIILISPFLGSRGLIDEVERSGGLREWSASTDYDADADRTLLHWLASYPHDRSPLPIYLGYGRGDRFAGAHRIVSEILPDDRIIAIEGGHNWQTWAVLWRRLLAVTPFLTMTERQS